MKHKLYKIKVNILKKLENSYVIKYYESFNENNNLNIIMEYCEGGDLSQYIKA
jgi:NIMA (never in mitosis gene a)-related kinase